MIDADNRPARVTVPVLLVPAAGDLGSPTCRSLGAVLEQACAASAELELVRADSLAAAATELDGRRFAAVFVDAQSSTEVRAALDLGAHAAARAAAGLVSLVLVTSAVGEVAGRVDLPPRLAVDVLDAPAAPLLAALKLRACAATFRADLELRDGLDGAQRTAEELLATVSHDLRTPLNTVMLAAQRIELAVEGAPSAPVVERSVGMISRAVDRMSRLVGDLLDLARLDAGQSLPLEHEDVDLAVQVRVAAEMIEPLATARRITIAVVAHGPVRASCDPERVQQVLANLLGNAVKFTREGGAITLRLARDDDGDVLSVSDTGVGIPRDQLPRIFNAYWQQDAQRKRGAGLGLAIARAIALAHGGSLEVESTEGVGTTFFFRLPHRVPDRASTPELR